jgi:hypothetical protein
MRSKRGTLSIKKNKIKIQIDQNIDFNLAKDLIKIIKEKVDKKVPVVKSLKRDADDTSMIPSKVTNAYWIESTRQKGKYPKSTSRSGKWLIFNDKKIIDTLWTKIKSATEDGLLGRCSKVSTGLNNPNSRNTIKGVICVYTYDSADIEDVRRIRAELRQIGITNKIPYKLDQDTYNGKYEKPTGTISKFFE